MYEFIETPGYPEFEKSLIKKEENGKIWSIPQDLANSDYRAYLVWIEDQA